MLYTSRLKTRVFVLGAFMLLFAACKPKPVETTVLTSNDDNGGYASDAAKLDRNSNEAMSVADDAAITGGANLRITSTYPVITNDTSATPHVLTIDFGPTPHTCLDGRTRQGEIICTYTGHYKDSASTHTLTYSNYYIDGLKMTGSKTVTNMGTNIYGQVWYNVVVNDSLYLTTDSVVSWTGNRTRTWLSGYSTASRIDDEYLIGGTTVLKRANGHIFTYAISTSSPLKVKLSCPFIESGVVTISSSSFTSGDRTLDYGYGGGGCDALALLTIGSHTYIITLR